MLTTAISKEVGFSSLTSGLTVIRAVVRQAFPGMARDGDRPQSYAVERARIVACAKAPSSPSISRRKRRRRCRRSPKCGRSRDGVEGDRYCAGTGFYSKKSSYGGREVTLIEIEAVEALFGGVLNAEGKPFGIKLATADIRKIATSSVPLNHLVDREFLLGAVLMRGTRLCEPCMHLDDLTLHGVMSGLIHRGGLRVLILGEGVIRVSDAVRSKTS
jgi:hypothetical protein